MAYLQLFESIEYKIYNIINKIKNYYILHIFYHFIKMIGAFNQYYNFFIGFPEKIDLNAGNSLFFRKSFFSNSKK